jgi:hypothetical protein
LHIICYITQRALLGYVDDESHTTHDRHRRLSDSAVQYRSHIIAINSALM